MPYKMFKQNGKFCVKNEDTGESKGCSASRSMALGHMRALYAAEGGAKMGKKELDDLITKAVDDYNAEYPDDLVTKEDTAMLEKGFAPGGIYTFTDLTAYRSAQDLLEETSDLTSDFNSMVWNIMYASDIEDKAAAVKSLADEFTAILDNEISASQADAEGNNKELDEKASARADVSAADKKRAVAEYGNVTYADAKNKKYPVDTAEHIRAAWSYIGMPKNQKKYSPAEVASIKRKIISAWKSKIDKAGPPKASTKELLESFVGALKSLFSFEDDDEEVEDAETKECENCDDDQVSDTSDLMIWKEVDTGQYRWVGRYSNNFRDSDRPPEIISEASHKSFVEKVEKGLAPMPELWLWHIKEWKIGQADWLAYDDAGFALASGTFTKGLEDVAEWLMEQNNVLMSHGMPPSTVVYDKSDPSIIVEHETKEISVLPQFAAANKLTGFAVLGKEEVMAIPKEKKDFLIKMWNADPALLDRLEAMNAEVASAAKEAGLESKEIETKEEEVAQVEADTTAKTEEVVTETAVAEVPPTRQEIAEAVAAILTPLVDRLDTIEQSLDGVMSEVKEIKTAQTDQVKQVIDSTPVASLGALIAQRVIGDKSAAVDGRTELAKSKPKEAESESNHPIGIPFLDKMLTERETT